MSDIATAKRRSLRAIHRKDESIQIRASVETKALLNRAAGLRNQKLSEFMLACARRQAEETLLDRRSFFLDAKAHDRFLMMLDRPTMPNSAVRRRLNRKPSWER